MDIAAKSSRVCLNSSYDSKNNELDGTERGGRSSKELTKLTACESRTKACRKDQAQADDVLHQGSQKDIACIESSFTYRNATDQETLEDKGQKSCDPPVAKSTHWKSCTASLSTCKKSTSEELVSSTFIPRTVTFRKGEKSFLDFHQHYAITQHLGEGSYSTVKQVTHRQKGGFFACKIVDKLSLSAVDRTALTQEVGVLSSIHHVNIMRLYEVIEDDAKCYLVTELAKGGDLFDRIVTQGKFHEREAQKIAAALVDALHYCHEHSIIHRDVKPENVLLSDDDVKLCDFGFAKQLRHPNEQALDSCGTPGYAAPEILDGQSYGLEVDVFSLGVVTYIMLCGYPPFPMKLAQLRTHRFHVQYPSKDWAAIHPDVKTLISAMLRVDPMERPTMALLRMHPWIQAGRLILERFRREKDKRRRLVDLTRRQQAAAAIRKQLVMEGFDAIKYGRNGLPHRTKLRLSIDGQVMHWQPKLLKRSLLRYQNARPFTSLFGMTSKERTHPLTQECVLETESSRLPALCTEINDDLEHSIPSPFPTSSTDNSSNNTIAEKRLWWHSLRRERGLKTECTASSNCSFSSPKTSLGANAVRLETPETASFDRLDDSIQLQDIREMRRGDDAPFFTGYAMNWPNSSKRAVDFACVLSISTCFRDLHLEFPNQGLRDGFLHLLQQATLPLQASGACEKNRTLPPPEPFALSKKRPQAPNAKQWRKYSQLDDNFENNQDEWE